MMLLSLKPISLVRFSNLDVDGQGLASVEEVVVLFIVEGGVVLNVEPKDEFDVDAVLFDFSFSTQFEILHS